jgi:hypothetical protein
MELMLLIKELILFWYNNLIKIVEYKKCPDHIYFKNKCFYAEIVLNHFFQMK